MNGLSYDRRHVSGKSVRIFSGFPIDFFAKEIKGQTNFLGVEVE